MWKKRITLVLTCLTFCVIPSPIYAREMGVYGPTCTDPQQAILPSVVEPGQPIKFESSGHSNVGDMTNGGLKVDGWVDDAWWQARADQKIGTVKHDNPNGTQFLERVHAVNENGKNVDYYTAGTVCGTYTWWHGSQCTEPEGQVFDCSCVYVKTFTVCSGQAAGSTPTQTPPAQTTLTLTPTPTLTLTPTLTPTPSLQPLKLVGFGGVGGGPSSRYIRKDLSDLEQALYYVIASVIFIMVIHFAIGISKEFPAWIMAGVFALGGILGYMLGSYEAGFIFAMVFTFLFW